MAIRRIRKRPERFVASQLSSPTIMGERPISFEEGGQELGGMRKAPAEALLRSIDQIAHQAMQIMRDCTADQDLNEPDTPTGFAYRVVAAAADLRSRIMNVSEPSSDALHLASDAMRLATLYHAMAIEFEDGDGIERWRELVETRRSAALSQQERRALQAAALHSRWQHDATGVWEREPKLTKAAVARILAMKYRRRRDTGPSASTIRQVIKKPDDEQCPPSADGAT